MSNQQNITDFSVNPDQDHAGIEDTYMKDMYQALERLEQNKDFKKVILDGYFKDYAVNQTSLLAMDYVRREGVRPQILERLVAISALQDYFMTIAQLGATSKDDAETDDESVEE